jgi:hypothetical protein
MRSPSLARPAAPFARPAGPVTFSCNRNHRSGVRSVAVPRPATTVGKGTSRRNAVQAKGKRVMSFIIVCFAVWALAWFGLVFGFDYRIRE